LPIFGPAELVWKLAAIDLLDGRPLELPLHCILIAIKHRRGSLRRRPEPEQADERQQAQDAHIGRDAASSPTVPHDVKVAACANIFVDDILHVSSVPFTDKLHASGLGIEPTTCARISATIAGAAAAWPIAAIWPPITASWPIAAWGTRLGLHLVSRSMPNESALTERRGIGRQTGVARS